MGRKSVAVLDVRSSEVSVLIGERGVNNTFVFKASRTEPYYGYDEHVFFDEKNLSDAVCKAIDAVERTCGERIRELYVGVPGQFTEVVPKEQNVGFPKRRRISSKDLDALFLAGKEELKEYRMIRATSMIYVTADNRRVVDPVGLASASLSGVLSYFYCSEYFASVMERIFSKMKISLRFLPAEYAMAFYLIPSETRDEYSIFLDVGDMSSTLLILLGNGVLAQRTYWVGKAHIAFLLSQQFSLPQEAAVSLLSRANLFAKDGTGVFEFNFRGTAYEIDMRAFTDKVREGLDMLCEAAGGFLEECSGRELDYKPLYITGEGLTGIRGALEHISKRLNRVCEQVAPDLPYYNKPSMSSRIALLNMAQDDRLKDGVINRLLNAFGG